MKNNSVTRKIARIISYAFIPPVMNLLTFIYLSTFYTGTAKLWTITLSVIFGVLLPITFFIVMRKKGKIDDDDAKIKEQRSVPYLFGIFLIILAIFLSGHLNLPNAISVVWLAYLLNSVLLLIINKFWKMSAHALGAAIPFGVAINFSLTTSIIFFIILVFTSLSRLILKVHTPAQVLAGAFTGILVTYLTIYFLG